MKCLQCSKKLPWLARLKNMKFCTEEHRKLYQEAHDKTAFAELSARKKNKEPESFADEEQVEEPERNEREEPAYQEVAEAGVLDRLEEHELAAGAEHKSGMPAEDARPASGESLEPDATPVSADLTAIEHAPDGVTAAPDEETSGDDGLAERYAHFLSMLDAERHYYQDLLDRLPAGVAVIGEDLKVAYSNRLFREMRDQEGGEADGLSITSPEVRNAIRAVLNGGSGGAGAGPVQLADEARSIRVEPITMMMKEEEGRPGALLFAARNPTREMAPTE